jgi:hypothetical protein
MQPALDLSPDLSLPSSTARAKPLRPRLVAVTPYLLVPEGAVPPPGIAFSDAPRAASPSPRQEVRQEADPCDHFVQALVGAAQALGATRAAAVLPVLIHEGRFEGLVEETSATLTARAFLEKDGTTMTPTFSATLAAWLDVVRGKTTDLGACGAATLDTWAADLICALAGAPRSRASDYRRELRRRGVAAFGLIAV